MIRMKGAPTGAHQLAEQAAGLVQQNIGSPGQVQMTFTDSRGMADLNHQAELALMPGMTSQVRKHRIAALRRETRRNAGLTLITPNAGLTLVLINADQTPGKHLARTLVHELVHAVQLANPQARAAHLRYLRHACGIEDMPARDFRQYMRQMDQQEKEAHRAERLARHITR